MITSFPPVRAFDHRLVDGLYVEAIVLADEARAFFSRDGVESRAGLDQLERLDFACESLKVTTRIMHVIAWLLTQRAVFAEELPETVRCDEAYQLGEAAPTAPEVRALLGEEMGELILASEDLHQRVARLEQHLINRVSQAEMPQPGPARDLLSRLEQSL